MKPYIHQKELWKLNPERYLLSWECGTAKTRTFIELAAMNCQSALFVVPKALRENWKREIEKWLDGRNLEWRVIHKEEFKSKWDSLDAYDGVIIDECHFFGNFKSQLHKAMASYFKKHDTKYRWLGSATCYLSSAWNIYSLAKLLGHDWDYMKFKRAFFYDVKMGNRTVPIQKDNIEVEIAKLVNFLGSTVKLNECADVPEQTFSVEYLEKTEDQKEVIKNIYEPLPIVRWTKVHEVENGILNGDEGYENDLIIDNNKEKRIIDICTENNKVAVFCRYNLQLYHYELLLKAIGFNVLLINGSVKDKDSVVQLAESLDKCVVLINASCSEGYELPSIGTVVFASMDFSVKNYTQAQGRFLRINKLKKNHYIHLLSGEIDEAVYKNVAEKKMDFQIAIYNYDNKENKESELPDNKVVNR